MKDVHPAVGCGTEGKWGGMCDCRGWRQAGAMMMHRFAFHTIPGSGRKWRVSPRMGSPAAARLFMPAADGRLQHVLP